MKALITSEAPCVARLLRDVRMFWSAFIERLSNCQGKADYGGPEGGKEKQSQRYEIRRPGQEACCCQQAHNTKRAPAKRNKNQPNERPFVPEKSFHQFGNQLLVWTIAPGIGAS